MRQRDALEAITRSTPVPFCHSRAQRAFSGATTAPFTFSPHIRIVRLRLRTEPWTVRGLLGDGRTRALQLHRARLGHCVVALFVFPLFSFTFSPRATKSFPHCVVSRASAASWLDANDALLPSLSRAISAVLAVCPAALCTFAGSLSPLVLTFDFLLTFSICRHTVCEQPPRRACASDESGRIRCLWRVAACIFPPD